MQYTAMMIVPAYGTCVIVCLWPRTRAICTVVEYKVHTQTVLCASENCGRGHYTRSNIRPVAAFNYDFIWPDRLSSKSLTARARVSISTEKWALERADIHFGHYFCRFVRTKTSLRRFPLSIDKIECVWCIVHNYDQFTHTLTDTETHKLTSKECCSE